MSLSVSGDRRAWGLPGLVWLPSAAQGCPLSGDGVSVSASCSGLQRFPSGPAAQLCEALYPSEGPDWATWEEARDSPSSFLANPRSQLELMMQLALLQPQAVSRDFLPPRTRALPWRGGDDSRRAPTHRVPRLAGPTAAPPAPPANRSTPLLPQAQLCCQ